MSEKIRYAEYKLGKHKITREKIVTKDGHTMFLGDIVTDLNRKSFLESEISKLKEEKERLQSKYEDKRAEIADHIGEISKLRDSLERYRVSGAIYITREKSLIDRAETAEKKLEDLEEYLKNRIESGKVVLKEFRDLNMTIGALDAQQDIITTKQILTQLDKINSGEKE